MPAHDAEHAARPQHPRAGKQPEQERADRHQPVSARAEVQQREQRRAHDHRNGHVEFLREHRQQPAAEQQFFDARLQREREQQQHDRHQRRGLRKRRRHCRELQAAGYPDDHDDAEEAREPNA